MRKILIGEDDTLLNKTLAYNLTSEGYEAASAYTHAAAVGLLQKGEFDLVRLDINLPDGSGRTSARKSATGASKPISCS